MQIEDKDEHPVDGCSCCTGTRVLRRAVLPPGCNAQRHRRQRDDGDVDAKREGLIRNAEPEQQRNKGRAARNERQRGRSMTTPCLVTDRSRHERILLRSGVILRAPNGDMALPRLRRSLRRVDFVFGWAERVADPGAALGSRVLDFETGSFASTQDLGFATTWMFN